METISTVEVSELVLDVEIGTYGPEDVVPEAHLLDLSLAIDPALVLIEADEMARVFDYDPLVAEIDRLARERHYATQERLLTRIGEAIAGHHAVTAATLHLRKRPVLRGSGSLGIRLVLGPEALVALRSAPARAGRDAVDRPGDRP